LASFSHHAALAGINIPMISTSEIKISVIIDETEGPRATQVAHVAVKLGGS